MSAAQRPELLPGEYCYYYPGRAELAIEIVGIASTWDTGIPDLVWSAANVTSRAKDMTPDYPARSAGGSGAEGRAK
jgi:hypothetical protein